MRSFFARSNDVIYSLFNKYAHIGCNHANENVLRQNGKFELIRFEEDLLHCLINVVISIFMREREGKKSVACQDCLSVHPMFLLTFLRRLSSKLRIKLDFTFFTHLTSLIACFSHSLSLSLSLHYLHSLFSHRLN
jgi:hypothetical protein